MITGCYVLHVYCDDPDHQSWQEGYHNEYTGETGSRARVAARRAGWTFDGEKTFCRKHKQKKPVVLREHVLWHPCPYCQAQTGERCRGRTRERDAFHSERWALAREVRAAANAYCGLALGDGKSCILSKGHVGAHCATFDVAV